jgi:hypothetical protein
MAGGIAEVRVEYFFDDVRVTNIGKAPFWLEYETEIGFQTKMMGRGEAVNLSPRR